MNETVLNRMMELLDIQQDNCFRAGADVSMNTLEKPKGGNEKQNSYYYGHLNMAEALTLEIGKRVQKADGKHILVDERR